MSPGLRVYLPYSAVTKAWRLSLVQVQGTTGGALHTSSERPRVDTAAGAASAGTPGTLWVFDPDTHHASAYRSAIDAATSRPATTRRVAFGSTVPRAVAATSNASVDGGRPVGVRRPQTEVSAGRAATAAQAATFGSRQRPPDHTGSAASASAVPGRAAPSGSRQRPPAQAARDTAASGVAFGSTWPRTNRRGSERSSN